MNANRIKFGVEIESFVPHAQRTNFRNGPYHNGNQINHAPDGWNAQRDGSLRSGSRNRFGTETVSPILEGENGLAESFYMAEYLNEINATTNATCGLHIHVDARTFSPRQIENIRRAFILYEKAFFGLSGRGMARRMESNYCRPFHRWDRTRFQSLNLTNLTNRKGTVEIRCFPGTTNPEIITTAAYMSVALVAYATRQNGELDLYSPIVEPLTAARNFCNEILSDSKNLIIPDEPANDIIAVIIRQARAAERQMLADAPSPTFGESPSYSGAVRNDWRYEGERQVSYSL